MNDLIAQLAIAPVKHGRLQQGRWVEIRKGPRKQITCSCGSSTADTPHDFERTIEFGLCRHLNAMYTGAITEDHKQARLFGDLHYQKEAPRFYVRLTQLGSQMFRWRWAAQALSTKR